MNKLGIALVLLCWAVAGHSETLEISFETADGITIFGDLYASGNGKSAPVILLFHQAGSDARGEYGGIARRLLDAGYNVLAVDQRSGGSRLGGTNRTVARLGDTDFGYCEVYPDLQATLEYARGAGFDGSLAVWGSSYSAALVFQLAAKNPDDVDAVLGFSPASGGPLADCRPEAYLAALQPPALALRPTNEAAIESVKAQLATFEQRGVKTYIADPGVHGSSMLNEDRVGESAEATWAVVMAFLEENLKQVADGADSP